MPNYQLPGFKAVHPQLAISILHSHNLNNGNIYWLKKFSQLQ